MGSERLRKTAAGCWSLPRLAEFVRGEMDEARAEACRRHLEKCSACRFEAARLTEALSALKQVPLPSPPERALERLLHEVHTLPDPVSRVWSPLRAPLVLGVAASLLVGIFIVAVVWQRQGLVPPWDSPAAQGQAASRGMAWSERAAPGPADRAFTPDVSSQSVATAGSEAAKLPSVPAGERTAGIPSAPVGVRPAASDGGFGGQPSHRPSNATGGAAGLGPAREAAPPQLEAGPPVATSVARTSRSTDTVALAPMKPAAVPERGRQPEQSSVVQDAAQSRPVAPAEALAPAGPEGGVEMRPVERKGPAAPRMAPGAAPSTSAAGYGDRSSAPRAKTLSAPVGALGLAGPDGSQAWTVSDDFWQIRVDVPEKLVEKTEGSLGLTLRGRADLTGVHAHVEDCEGVALGPAIHVAALPRGKQIEASLPVLPPQPGRLDMAVVVAAEEPQWHTDIPVSVSVEPRPRGNAERPVALVLREVALKTAATAIGRAAGIEVQVPDNMAELVVDADFGQPIPAKAALEVLAEQVDAELVATDQGFRFTKDERDDKG